MSKCVEPSRLIGMIKSSFNISPDESTIGQFIFRFDNGLVCNVYSTGTVLYQGKAKDEKFHSYRMTIESYIEKLNKGD